MAHPSDRTGDGLVEDERKVVAMGEPLQAIAVYLDRLLAACAAAGGFEPWGFALSVFAHDGPEAVYVSNCERADMIRALREQADKLERGETTTRAPGGGKLN